MKAFGKTNLSRFKFISEALPSCLVLLIGLSLLLLSSPAAAQSNFRPPQCTSQVYRYWFVYNQTYEQRSRPGADTWYTSTRAAMCWAPAYAATGFSLVSVQDQGTGHVCVPIDPYNTTQCLPSGLQRAGVRISGKPLYPELGGEYGTRPTENVVYNITFRSWYNAVPGSYLWFEVGVYAGQRVLVDDCPPQWFCGSHPQRDIFPYLCEISGSYCPARSTQWTLCPPGTYCPYGKFNAQPMICPEGRYCSGNGTNDAGYCPLDRYCPPGTAVLPPPPVPKYTPEADWIDKKCGVTLQPLALLWGSLALDILIVLKADIDAKALGLFDVLLLLRAFVGAWASGAQIIYLWTYGPKRTGLLACSIITEFNAGVLDKWAVLLPLAIQWLEMHGKWEAAYWTGGMTKRG